MKFITPEIDFENHTESGLYNGDTLANRELFGTNLIEIISLIEDGAVISIDASWGEGKTTFIKWWQKHLENEEYSNIILDAFEHDFQGDAFTSIFPVLAEMFKKNESKWKNIGSNIKGKFESFVNKGAGAIAGALATVACEDPEAAKVVGVATNAFITSILSGEKPQTLHQKLSEFKSALNEFTTSVYMETGKPFIFIIDELDRCRPNFAVEMLEKIKHFFAVPGIIWVLAINKDQLAESIKHIYGNEQPHLYFEKFIHIQTSLPKSLDQNSNGSKDFIKGHYSKFIQQHIGYSAPDGSLFTFISIMYKYYQFSLREIKRHLLYLKILKVQDNYDPLPYLLSILYIKSPEQYKEIRNNSFNKEEFLDSYKWLMEFKENNGYVKRLLGIIMLLSYKTSEVRRAKFELYSGNIGNSDDWSLCLKSYCQLMNNSRHFEPYGDFLKVEKYIQTINSFEIEI